MPTTAMSGPAAPRANAAWRDPGVAATAHANRTVPDAKATAPPMTMATGP